MKKLLRILMLPVFAGALLLTVRSARSLLKTRNWYRTTLTVTFIGLPDGTVFGDYTDAHGTLHQNEPALPFSFGDRNHVEQYYGTEIAVLNDPDTGELVKADGMVSNLLLSGGVTLLSGGLFLLLRPRKTGYGFCEI